MLKRHTLDDYVARVAEIVRRSRSTRVGARPVHLRAETPRIDEVSEAVDELTQLSPVAPHGLDLLRRELVVEL